MASGTTGIHRQPLFAKWEKGSQDRDPELGESDAWLISSCLDEPFHSSFFCGARCQQFASYWTLNPESNGCSAPHRPNTPWTDLTGHPHGCEIPCDSPAAIPVGSA